MALESIKFPLISPPESPLAALLKNALSSYDTVQNLKVNNIKNKYVEPQIKAALAQHAAELEGLKIKNQYLPQSMQAEIALNQARLAGENINNQYLPQLLGAKIEKLKNAAQGQQTAPLSNVGKLERDYENAVAQYGEDSPQAIMIKSAIEKYSTTPTAQKRVAAERALEPHVKVIEEYLPDVKKYFGAFGKAREGRDIVKGSPDIEKFKLFNSALEFLKGESSILMTIPAFQEARKDFSHAFDVNSWTLRPDQAERSLKKIINLIQESGKLSTIPGYKMKNNNQEMIMGSDGKEYSIDELHKIKGGIQ